MSVPQPPEDGPCAAPSGTCQEALHDLERYLDGELPDADLSQIREHLAACYPCADRATFEEQLRALIRERCAEKAPAGLTERIRAQLGQVS
jgi:mycothiol system anti-sigma-R factor